jgi:hypothetical protein
MPKIIVATNLDHRGRRRVKMDGVVIGTCIPLSYQRKSITYRFFPNDAEDPDPKWVFQSMTEIKNNLPNLWNKNQNSMETL